MHHPSRVRMTAPLAPHQDVIWTDLLSRGYTRLSAKNLLRLAAHLSRWMYAEELSPQGLTRDRGLGSLTAARRIRTAQRFFADLGVGDVADVRRLSTADVSGSVLRQANAMSIGSAKLLVSDLRALLRYLHVRALCGDVAAAAVAIAGRRHARLPKHIPWKEVQRLLSSCDLRTAIGRRDHAIMLLLARLGLPAREVAVLGLTEALSAEQSSLPGPQL